MASPKKKAEQVPVEWRELPPKIGRKPADRPDAIEAGKRIRAMLEASRRARGVPKEGTLYPGEAPDTTVSRKRTPRS